MESWFERNNRAEKYWKKMLKGFTSKAFFPYDFKSGEFREIELQEVNLKIPSTISEKIFSISNNSEHRVHMIFCTSIIFLLNFYNKKQIEIGIPVYKSKNDQGALLNSFLPLITVIDSETSFKDLLVSVGKDILEANNNKDFIFNTHLHKLGIESSNTNNFPLFDCFVVLRNVCDNIDIHEIATNLNFIFEIVDNEIYLKIEFNKHLYCEQTIRILYDYLLNIINSAIFDVNKKLDTIEVLSKQDKLQLLQNINKKKFEYDKSKKFLDYFLKSKTIFKDKIAVTCENSFITYHELNVRANKVANYIVSLGVPQNSIIAILSERDISMLEIILGIWKSKCTYLPIDKNYPNERIESILADSNASVIFVSSDFDRDNLKKTNTNHIVAVDFLHELIIEKDDCEITSLNNIDINPAYLIYTSGSTGKPKGVLVEHEGMLNHLFAKINDLNLNENSVIVQNASHTFDISIWQFIVSLMVGGTTFIIKDNTIMNISRFVKLLVRNNVTILEIVPSYFSVLLDFIRTNKIRFRLLEYLILTGEELSPKLVNEWLKYYANIPIVNAYGPTEASDDITHFLINKTVSSSTVPIGSTINNLNIYIFDDHFRLCGVGMKGEICVSGIGVGLGYLNYPEKTSTSFVKDPFIDDNMMYRTGDIGSWTQSGEIMFYGRMDHQVKIRGNRIELAEIENRLELYPTVSKAVAIVDDSVLNNEKVIAFVKLVDTTNIEQIKEHLIKYLPKYMIPERIEIIGDFPKTQNGKIDRNKLKRECSRSNENNYLIENTNKIVHTNNLENIDSCSQIEITETDKKKLIYEFNSDSRDYLKNITFHKLIKNQVDRIPDAVAIVSQDSFLTFKELEKRANFIANKIIAVFGKENSIIPIFCEKSIELIIGIYAILKSGNAFICIDDDDFDERIMYILNDINCSIALINQKNQSERLKKRDIAYIDVTDTLSESTPIVNDIENHSKLLAYAIYTSGTTGDPQAVLVEHRMLVNMIYGFKDIFKINANDRLMQIAPPTFDVSIGDYSKSLPNGCPLILANNNDIVNGENFYKTLNKYAITILETVPYLIVDLNKYIYQTKQKIKGLRILISGSDVLQLDDYQRINRNLGEGIELYNTFGVTEATIDSSYFKHADHLSYNNVLPIGVPYPNVQLYILDSEKNLAPINQKAELFIGGNSVARGYLNCVELTNERFIELDIGKSRKEQCYKTGDIAKWLPNGLMEFYGRIDRQININGLRIEPIEIENGILKSGYVENVAVIKVIINNNDTIVAFFEEKKPVNLLDLKKYLLERIPIFMVPNYFIKVKSLPKTKNGKIDYKSLKNYEIKNISTENIPPQNYFEEQVIEICSRILNIPKDRIGIKTDLFELGINSLNLIIMISRIQEEFGIDVTVNEMLEKSTLKELSETIINKKFSDKNKKHYLVINQGQKKNIFLFPPMLGYGFFYNSLKDSLSEYSLYSFDFIENENRIEKYVECIRSIQPEGPIVIMGFSAPGELMLEIAGFIEKHDMGQCEIIIIDGSRLGKYAPFFEKYSDESFLEIKKTVHELMVKSGLESLKKEAEYKMKTYHRYLKSLTFEIQISSNIYYIWTQDSLDQIKKEALEIFNKALENSQISSYDEILDYMNWGNATNGKNERYEGVGKHEEMFFGKNLIKNAEIIKNILNSI